MAVPRVLACLAIVVASLTAALPANASSTDACAQRVIRDWYDGGRVDGVYALPCYRAAIRALPEDVLQYSDARNEIERALAHATRGLADRARGGVARPAVATAKERPSDARSEFAARPTPHRAGTRVTPPPAAPTATATLRAFDDPVQLAAREDLRVADARGVPYPVVVLATLAALLLATAAAARVMTRRRGSGSTPDR